MFELIIFCGAAFVIGYLAGEEGGILNLFDFDERWIKKQNANFKKYFDILFK